MFESSGQTSAKPNTGMLIKKTEDYATVIEARFKSILNQLKSSLNTQTTSPSIFLVYAHDAIVKSKHNPSTSIKLPEANAAVAVKLIQYLKEDLGLTLYSDLTPKAGESEIDILQSQLCLLHGNPETVDYVVLCGSELLHSYIASENNVYKQYQPYIDNALNHNPNPKTHEEVYQLLGDLKDMVRQFGYQNSHKDFHHLMTELAFLRKRKLHEDLPNQKNTLIPILLNGNQQTALPEFVDKWDVYLGDARWNQAGRWKGKRTFTNQGLQQSVFKILYRLFTDKASRDEIKKYKAIYQKFIDGLNQSPLNQRRLEHEIVNDSESSSNSDAAASQPEPREVLNHQSRIQKKPFAKDFTKGDEPELHQLSSSKLHSVQLGEPAMELTLDYIKSFRKDDKALFKALAEQGKTWEKLLQTHVFDSELTQEQRVEGEAVMNALIERRDRLDYQTYKEAIKALFPKADYHIDARLDGTPQENAWGFKLKYFWFDVYVGEKSLPSMTNSETPCVRIKVAAPGSRELTSDIDATVSVHCLDHELLKEVKWPKALKVKVTEGSASSLIGWGVISYFNNLSFKSLGVTSATSRDTNVYVDGFYKEHLEQGEPVYDADRSYPKFKMNPIITEAMEGIQEKRLLEEDLRNFYSANKKTKQTLELAASLVPLREYFDLEGRDWNINFTYTLVDETMDLPKEARQKYKNSIRSACSKADEFYQYKKTLLAEAEISNKDKEFLSKSDKSIDCMNELYAEHLLKLAGINQKIYQQEAQIKIIQNKLKQNQEEIDELSEFLSGKDSDAIAKSRRLLKFQKELTAYREQSLTLHRKLESALKSLAKLYNEQQASQIRANLFAQEAYINRASVYHVVAWMQSAVDDLRINFKQVVMGSILQQIGFRLLHSAQFERARMATGEILYRISKYGHRVGDMVYGDVNQPFDNQHAIKQKFDLKGTSVLRRLSSKTHTLKDSWHRIISQDIEFLLSVKKNPDIKIQKKGVTAVACYKKWVFSILYPDQYTKFLDGGFEPNDIPAYVAGKVSEANVTEWLQTDKQAWVDLARYIIVKTYQARFADKKYFWGDAVMSVESSISLPSTASHGAESTPVSTLPQPSIHSDPNEESQYQPQQGGTAHSPKI